MKKGNILTDILSKLKKTFKQNNKICFFFNILDF